MVVQETYLDISLYEVEKIVERHGRKTSLDLALPEVRRGIRSLIKLHSSIQRVAEDMAVNRSALSRWLSGESALGIDGVSKVLKYLGLNRNEEDEYEGVWRIALDWNSLDQSSQDLQNAIALLYSAPPECLVIQVSDLSGRSTKFKAILLHLKTTVNIEISIPTRLARLDQGLAWFVSAFGGVRSLAIYCPLDVESHITENNASSSSIDA